MKKVLSAVLSLLMVAVLLPLPLYTASADTSGQCGDNLYWSFDENTGTLTITGSGDMWDYDRSDHAYAPWYTGYYGGSPIRQIEIAQGVTHIGSCAFDFCDGITTISIPGSVVSIGDKAFSSCQELSDVQLSEGLEVIGDRAFQGCYNLDMIEIPSTVTTVGSFVFGSGDATIDAVFHGNPPNSIGRHCFTDEMGCWVGAIIYPDEFSSAWSPNGETEWNGYAILPRSQYALLSGSCGTGLTWYFDDASGLLSIEGKGEMTMDELPAMLGGDIPYTFTKQPWKAHRKDITGVVLSDGIVNISSKAFQNCTGLTSVTIPDGVTSIGRFAFNGCSNLMEISLPDSVTSIGDQTFKYCSSLLSIMIPDNVTSIESYAFYGCTSLTTITIPHSVTSIGGGAFYGCLGLTDVYYLGTEKQQEEIWIEEGNDPLINAVWHYNTDPDPVQKCGDNLYWEFDEATGTLTITGSGDMDDYEGGSSPWISYAANIRAVILPEGLTSIGSCAFEMPWSYETYDWSSLLETVSIPASVTKIGAAAFYGCSSLRSITIPDGVTSIERTVFYACRSLESVSIPNSVTSIGNFAFCYCGSLTSVTIPDGVTSIGDRAFSGTSLTTITIPASVVSIGEDALPRTSLSAYIVDLNNENYCAVDGVLFTKGMDTLLFYPAANIQTVYEIPNGVTSIGTSAFSGSSLISVIIPEGVTSIGDDAFNWCRSLTSVSFPNGLKSIGASAFRSCESLTFISISESVTSIGSGAFDGCTGLTDIYYGGTETQKAGITIRGGNYPLLDADWHYNCTDPDPIEPNTIKPDPNQCGNNLYWSFDGQNGMLTITGSGKMWNFDYWDDSMDSQPPWASFRQDITSVVLPDGLINIGICAFYDCDGLTSVTIPEGVTRIGHFAFFDCDGLTSVTIPEEVTYIGEQSFYACQGLISIKIPERVTIIGSYAFYGCTGLTSITIPDSVVEIEGCVFYECTALQSVMIPDSVTSIDNAVFYGCTALQSVMIPDSVTSIGDYAFKGCTSLTDIAFPDSVTSIGYQAFSGCNKLTDIYYLGTEAQKAEMMIDDGNDCLENAVWHYLHAQIVSQSLTLEGDIRINFYVSISDDALADEGSFAKLTLNGVSQTQLVKDAPVSVKDGVTRRLFTQNVVAKEMQDAVTLELFDSSGRRLVLFRSDGTEVDGGYDYAATDYAAAAATAGLGEELETLVEACVNYGIAAQIQFGYEEDGLTLPQEVTAVTAAQVKPFEAGYTGELPAGIARNTSTLLIESDNTIRQYFYLAGGHTINEFTFTVDGVVTDPIRVSDSKYYLEVANIPAKRLDEAHTFTVTDGTTLYSIAYSALSYAYKALSYDDTISPVNLKNMARAIFLYNQAANDYFDNN